MSEFVLISDPHLRWETPGSRLDNIISTQDIKWNFILDYCQSHKAPLIVAGDLFDAPRGYRILYWFGQLLLKYPDVKVYAVHGQHDNYYRNEEPSTSFGILSRFGYIRYLNENPTGIDTGVDGVYVYGCSYGHTTPVPQDTEAHNILVIHKMITPRPLFVGQTFTDASYFLAKEAKGYDLVLVGDPHIKFNISAGNRIICNTGPLIRAEASEDMINHKPCIFVYDTEAMSIQEVEVPHSPADEVLSREHLERKKEIQIMLDTFVETLQATDMQTGMSFIDNLDNFVRVNNISDSVQKILSETMEEE